MKFLESMHRWYLFPLNYFWLSQPANWSQISIISGTWRRSDSRWPASWAAMGGWSQKIQEQLDSRETTLISKIFFTWEIFIIILWFRLLYALYTYGQVIQLVQVQRTTEKLCAVSRYNYNFGSTWLPHIPHYSNKSPRNSNFVW